MLQADVEELRTRLEEKNRLIEKKTQSAVQAVQERNKMSNELVELKDHMDIKDRKINVLQRKVSIASNGASLKAGWYHSRVFGIILWTILVVVTDGHRLCASIYVEELIFVIFMAQSKYEICFLSFLLNGGYKAMYYL